MLALAEIDKDSGNVGRNVMPNWQPGANPFPEGKIKRISGLSYTGELKFVRHAEVHLDRTPRSLW